MMAFSFLCSDLDLEHETEVVLNTLTQFLGQADFSTVTAFL